MKEKLELKHLAPYLPYGLKIKKEGLNPFSADGYTELIEAQIGMALHRDYKPILRPLSDLTRVRDDGKCFLADLKWEIPRFSYEINFDNGLILSEKVGCTPFLVDTIKVSDFMFKNHFDVFGLIEKGLAININTLDQ